MSQHDSPVSVGQGRYKEGLWGTWEVESSHEHRGLESACWAIKSAADLAPLLLVARASPLLWVGTVSRLTWERLSNRLFGLQSCNLCFFVLQNLFLVFYTDDLLLLQGGRALRRATDWIVCQSSRGGVDGLGLWIKEYFIKIHSCTEKAESRFFWNCYVRAGGLSCILYVWLLKYGQSHM